MTKTKGWPREPARHALAAKGVKTSSTRTPKTWYFEEKDRQRKEEAKTRYRVIFAPDGEHWIDNKANDYRNPSDAVTEAKTFVGLVPGSKVKVVNTTTGFVVFERSG